MQAIRVQVWWFGIVFWVFGLLDRSVAAFADGSIAWVEAWQVFVAVVFFFLWAVLRPDYE